MDITLALGGGGVKGNAHIGVLRVLVREGIKIRSLAGTSAGGLWGSLFAAGYTPAEIEAGMSELEHHTLYHRQPGDGPSMMGLAGIHQLLDDKLGSITFEDLQYPFAVTAVNLDTAQTLVIRTGRVVDAVMATIAVPGVFPPVKWNGQLLVDGGVLNPVPVDVARSLAPDLPVVAVVLSPPIDHWNAAERPRLFDSMPFIARYLARLRIAQSFNIFVRSVDIAGAMLTDLRLKIEQPEVIIRPNVFHIGFLDEPDVGELARQGEVAAEKALPAIRQATGWPARVRRRLQRLAEFG